MQATGGQLSCGTAAASVCIARTVSTVRTVRTVRTVCHSAKSCRAMYPLVRRLYLSVCALTSSTASKKPEPSIWGTHSTIPPIRREPLPWRTAALRTDSTFPPRAYDILPQTTSFSVHDSVIECRLHPRPPSAHRAPSPSAPSSSSTFSNKLSKQYDDPKLLLPAHRRPVRYNACHYASLYNSACFRDPRLTDRPVPRPCTLASFATWSSSASSESDSSTLICSAPSRKSSSGSRRCGVRSTPTRRVNRRQPRRNK